MAYRGFEFQKANQTGFSQVERAALRGTVDDIHTAEAETGVRLPRLLVKHPSAKRVANIAENQLNLWDRFLGQPPLVRQLILKHEMSHRADGGNLPGLDLAWNAADWLNLLEGIGREEPGRLATMVHHAYARPEDFERVLAALDESVTTAGQRLQAIDPILYLSGETLWRHCRRDPRLARRVDAVAPADPALAGLQDDLQNALAYANRLAHADPLIRDSAPELLPRLPRQRAGAPGADRDAVLAAIPDWVRRYPPDFETLDKLRDLAQAARFAYEFRADHFALAHSRDPAAAARALGDFYAEVERDWGIAHSTTADGIITHPPIAQRIAMLDEDVRFLDRQPPSSGVPRLRWNQRGAPDPIDRKGLAATRHLWEKDSGSEAGTGRG